MQPWSHDHGATPRRRWPGSLDLRQLSINSQGISQVRRHPGSRLQTSEVQDQAAPHLDFISPCFDRSCPTSHSHPLPISSSWRVDHKGSTQDSAGCISYILRQDRGLPELRKLLRQRAKCSVGGVWSIHEHPCLYTHQSNMRLSPHTHTHYNPGPRT